VALALTLLHVYEWAAMAKFDMEDKRGDFTGELLQKTV
jgi:hypothetical protein